MIRRVLLTLAIVVAPALAVLLITYEIISVDVISFMEDQPAVDYQEAPRRLPPEGAIPLSRPAYGAGGNPVPADEVSLQRGAVLYALHCAVCHGPAGQGDGSVVAFWSETARPPADLSEARIADYPASTIYRIITQGLGGMPPLRENLTERQRWDVINHVHSLQP
jgi:mono/diheme cytochrome c family protein